MIRSGGDREPSTRARRLRAVGAVAALVALSAPARARAEPRERAFERSVDSETVPTAPTVEEPPPRFGPPYWYGWQVNVVDAASLPILVTTSDERPLQTWVWLGVYALGGPVVHAAHGRGWRALGSFGMRVAGTAAGVMAFAIIRCHDYRDPDTDEEIATCGDAATGLLLMMYGAAVVDSLIDADDRPRLLDPAPAVSLTLAPLRGGFALGAIGRF